MSKDMLLDKNKGGRYSLKGSRLHGIFWALVLILIDQLTKLVADTYFNLAGSPDSVDVIPGWISLCIRYNDGIAYGVGADASPYVKLGVIGATGVIMLVLTILGALELLTPANMFLYQLAWMIPGLLITEWTRAV